MESRLLAAYKVQIGDKGRQCSRYNGGKLTRRCAVWGVSAADKSSAFDKIEKFNRVPRRDSVLGSGGIEGPPNRQGRRHEKLIIGAGRAGWAGWACGCTNHWG